MRTGYYDFFIFYEFVMILKEFIIETIHTIIQRPHGIREIEFDLNVSPAIYHKDGKEVMEIVVIGEGNPNHSRIKFKVQC